MAWTEITREKYRRDGMRYASDVTDAEWAVIGPRLPAPSQSAFRSALGRELLRRAIRPRNGHGCYSEF